MSVVGSGSGGRVCGWVVPCGGPSLLGCSPVGGGDVMVMGCPGGCGRSFSNRRFHLMELCRGTLGAGRGSSVLGLGNYWWVSFQAAGSSSGRGRLEVGSSRAWSPRARRMWWQRRVILRATDRVAILWP